MAEIKFERMLETIREIRENKGNIFVCGNGGSSATAEHLSNDLFSRDVRAVCLNSNASIMTMIARLMTNPKP
mgnify:CR=1 FL=1